MFLNLARKQYSATKMIRHHLPKSLNYTTNLELSSWIATGQVLDSWTATGQVWPCLPKSGQVWTASGQVWIRTLVSKMVSVGPRHLHFAKPSSDLNPSWSQGWGWALGAGAGAGSEAGAGLGLGLGPGLVLVSIL